MNITDRQRREEALYHDNGNMTRRALCARVAALESLVGELWEYLGGDYDREAQRRFGFDVRQAGVRTDGR